jgi:hypothetical protein
MYLFEIYNLFNDTFSVTLRLYSAEWKDEK